MPARSTTEKAIAALRRNALAMLAEADSLEAELRADGAELPPLVGSARRTADYILARAPVMGQEVADAAGVAFDTFRKDHVPQLRARGFVNIPGFGYAPPGWTPQNHPTKPHRQTKVSIAESHAAIEARRLELR